MEIDSMNQKMIRFILGCLVFFLLLAGSACSLGGGKESDTTLELPEDVDSLIMLAKFDIVLKTGADIEKISTDSVEETNFSDASLGVPEPGVEYTAVVTPGYIFILKYAGDTYEYHASGERVVQVP